MRHHIVITLLGVLFLTGCPVTSTPSVPVVTTPAEVKPAPPPPIGGLPVSLTVKQRSKTAVPGSSEKLVLSASDITDGQVVVSLETGSDIVLKPVSMKRTDEQTFRYGNTTYTLKLAEMHNALIGEDFAKFSIAEASRAAPLTEAQKIDRLIAAVEALEGATFVRNGTEHSPKEAAKHLREKRDYAGAQLKTADQFIEEIASKSSLSGDEYEIRFSDGRVVKAGEFLKGELKKLSIKM
jgi:hypothetical protein